jgi:hypothetical protein
MQSTSTTSIHGTPSFMGAFTPPVPPLPNDTPRRTHTATTSPIADVFTSYRGASNATKPLPPIQPSISNTASEESLVLVEQQTPLQIQVQLPESSVVDKSPNSFNKRSNHVKRRSMSVGEIELKQAMAESLRTSSLPPSKVSQNGETRGWDTTLNGILSDFKGELSQLDPVTSSLELRDPSTPARRVMLSRSKTDGLVFPFTANQDRRTPTLTLQPAPSCEDEEAREASSSSAPRISTSIEAPAIVPPQSSSLAPTRSGPGPSRSPTLKYGPRPLRSPNSYGHTHSASRDSARLRMHHRSSASSSEPSLIPVGAEGRVREPNVFCSIYCLAKLTFEHQPRLPGTHGKLSTGSFN